MGYLWHPVAMSSYLFLSFFDLYTAVYYHFTYPYDIRMYPGKFDMSMIRLALAWPKLHRCLVLSA